MEWLTEPFEHAFQQRALVTDEEEPLVERVDEAMDGLGEHRAGA